MKSAAAADVGARSARETLIELLALAYVMSSVVAVVLWWRGGGDWAGVWDEAVRAGEGVLPELGWVFGVYVPTLLGFYVLVIGEQLAQLTHVGRVRRLLGAVAEVSFAALVPGVLLALLYCVTEPDHLGELFVIVPTLGLLLFLVVQLGALVVFDTSVQLADALAAQARARAQLRALRPRSRKQVGLVIAVNIAVVAALGCATVAAAGAWSWLADGLTLVLVLAVAGAALLCTFAAFVAATIAGATVISRIGATIGLVAMWAVTLFFSWTLWLQAHHDVIPAIVGLIVMAAAATLTATLRPRRSWRLVADWTLTGAARTLLARVAARTHAKTTGRIRELEATLAANTRPPLRQRLSAAWNGLREG